MPALPAAIDSLGRRAPRGTALSSADLSGLSADYRRRHFFSARVENVRFLELAKSQLRKNVEQFGINRDRATFIANLNESALQLGLDKTVDPRDRGTLRDITSARRLGLIFDIQTGLAQGEAAHLAGLDPDLYNAAPAQALVRVREVRVPRDWPERWADAGGTFYDGRMIALKDDPIWTAISRFSSPWPPFDFASGMGVADVRRREAVGLGLVKKGERLAPVPYSPPAPAASVAGMSEPAVADLTAKFGDLAVLDRTGRTLSLDDTAVSDWFSAGPASGDAFSLGDIPAAGPGRSVAIRADDLTGLLDDPLTPVAGDHDWDELPGLLWMPDDISRETAPTAPGREAVTFSAKMRDQVWRAVVDYLPGELIGRLARFIRYTP